MPAQIVSLDPTYTFTVTGNRTLKAVFASVAPQEYSYTGSVAQITLYPGVYRLEAWGAEGGYRSSANYAGKGGYSVGTLTLTETTTVFVRSGGSGNTGGANGGFNGGGKRSGYPGGGGASDIRIGVDDANYRVIVAGGGGSDGGSAKPGKYGGGIAGGDVGASSSANGYGTAGYGGTQTGNSGGSSWITEAQSNTTTNDEDAKSGFGFGGNGVNKSGGYGGAGGGGWYGGTGRVPDGSQDDDGGGGGGSGFVWTGENAPTGFGLTEAYYLTNAQTIDGSQSFTSPTGTAETGHSGDGYVRITPVAFYVVTVVSEDTAKGTVSGGGQYENGAQATVTASPTSGYKLSGWYDGETQVSTSTRYTFTVSGNRTLTARFVEGSRLPDGYTEVEYIKSDSNCSINIGTPPIISKTKITLDICADNYVNSNELVYGAPSDNSRSFGLYRNSNTNFIAQCIVADAYRQEITKNISGERLTIECDLKNNILKIGDTETPAAQSTTNQMSTTIRLFSVLKQSYNMSIRAKLYSCQVYNGDEKVRDLVPCINQSNVVGLYDIVGNSFYSNDWTGTLTAGPAV